jgi:transmembrane sensor
LAFADAAWRGWVEVMNSSVEKARSAIAEQASECFVAHTEGTLDARSAEALAAWFKESPAHIEEFLGVSAVARDLRDARFDPNYSVEAILERARTEEPTAVQELWPGMTRGRRGTNFGSWAAATVAVAACAVVVVGLLLNMNQPGTGHSIAPDAVATLQLSTRHGEQLTRRLEDNSILHLNTDSAVSIRYSSKERLVTLTTGQATFEVAHEASRTFRVHAGSVDIVDVGTVFDVRLDGASALVTVVQGKVRVGRTTPYRPLASQPAEQQPIDLSADQQLRVTATEWPARPVAVDAKNTTAWLHRKVLFDNEPLEVVASEFNRYSSKPIEIATPALRQLRISGVFATDDPDAFIAFLRSLKGVHVEVLATQIRVSGT